MRFIVNKSKLSGEVSIPGSKSHTIRAIAFAALADGVSSVEEPLESDDTRSAVKAFSALGARFETTPTGWKITGSKGILDNINTEIDTGNSGTTIRIATGSAALATNSDIVLTGDEQIQKRPIGQLIDALNHLGAKAECLRGNGCPPVRITRPISGGRTPLHAPSSQFLSSLLINTPLAQGNTEIEVHELNEKPYIDMTLWWLDRLGIRYEHDGYDCYFIPGGQKYRTFSGKIPADFSSATFFAVAAAATGSSLTLKGLDMTDTQGDKAVFDILREMGAGIEIADGGIIVSGGNLHGGVFDLNATPDALPALAVAACAADGETHFVNVPQARMKETDRIAVMHAELAKLGADTEELPDGLIIRGGPLKGAKVDGHKDHRIVMALAVAGLFTDGTVDVATAESSAITFPSFAKLMTSCDADITSVQD